MNNPLIQFQFSNRNTIPFTQIKTEHYLPAVDEGIRQAKANIQKLKSDTRPANFENTILALETSAELLDLTLTVYYVLYSAEATPEHQALATEISTKTADYQSDVSLDSDLFQRVKDVYDNRASMNLNQEQKQLLEKTYKGFVRNGALLAQDKKEALRVIDQKLAQLGPKFSENNLHATNAYELKVTNKDQLKGLPESLVVAAKEAAEKKGYSDTWLITLQMPSFIPAMQYLDDEVIREQLWRAQSTKCFRDQFDNEKNVIEIVKLKNERVKILGYKTYADYVLEERMALSTDKVMSFLDRLINVTKNKAQKDLDSLAELKKQDGKKQDLKPWDVRYYEEKLKKLKYDINQEELRPYFQLEKVEAGAFELVHKLYGIRFQQLHDVPVYHNEVKVYEVTEETTGRHIGLLYADYFPRETKRSGAWMTDIQTQGLFRNSVSRPHVGIVMNFSRPSGGKPSLLTFDEVSTFFHEFGHALHGLLSDVTYRSLAGANVYWDFVELPSQFMENFLLEKPVLDLFARHYLTNEPMPIELFNKLDESSKFMNGYDYMRQLNFGLLDMTWYTSPAEKITDIEEFEVQATEKTRLLPHEKGTNISVAFGHIFGGGYAAGYYSYKWAEVLDADAFEYFKDNGLFSKEVAKKFREHILSRGGTEHPMELYKRFRGREPDPDALLRRDGFL